MSTHLAIATTAKGLLEQVRLPTPTPAPGEVLIRVHYAAVIPFDAYQLASGFHVSEYPVVLGFVSSGEVKALGHGVADLKEGDKVCTYSLPFVKNKAIQEYSIAPRASVVKVPDSFPLHEAASLPDNYATAMFTIFGQPNLAFPLPDSFPATSPPPNADLPILVYGAGSSSGQYMVQILKIAGYTKISATASSRNHAYLRELGVNQCFDFHSQDFANDILQASGGAKMSVVIDCISARPSMQAYSALVGEGTRVAFLMPLKEGEKISNDLDSELHLVIPSWVQSILAGASLVPIDVLRLHMDPVAKETFFQKILPQLFEKKIIRPNHVRLLKEGSLLERVQAGLNLLNTNKVSGERVVVKVSED